MNMERKITTLIQKILEPNYYCSRTSTNTLCDYSRLWQATFETSYREAILKIGSWILLELSEEQILALAHQTFTKQKPYHQRFDFMLHLLCTDASPGCSLSSYEKQEWFDHELAYMLQAD